MQHPVWNERFDVWQALPEGGTVEVQLWDSDSARKDDPLGRVTFSVPDILTALRGAAGAGAGDGSANAGAGNGVDSGLGTASAAQAGQEQAASCQQGMHQELQRASRRARRAAKSAMHNMAAAAAALTTPQQQPDRDPSPVLTAEHIFAIEVDEGMAQSYGNKAGGNAPARLFLRLTWVPEGTEAPWGKQRAGAPAQPWCSTALPLLPEPG